MLRALCAVVVWSKYVSKHYCLLRFAYHGSAKACSNCPWAEREESPAAAGADSNERLLGSSTSFATSTATSVEHLFDLSSNSALLSCTSIATSTSTSTSTLQLLPGQRAHAPNNIGISIGRGSGSAGGWTRLPLGPQFLPTSAAPQRDLNRKPPPHINLINAT